MTLRRIAAGLAIDRRIVRKDLRVLGRSPLALVARCSRTRSWSRPSSALVASYANAKPRVALVDEDGLPVSLVIGDRTFHVERTIDRVAEEVTLVRLDRDEAERQLAAGRIVALLIVPRGFVADLRGMVRSPQLELETTEGGLSIRVTQQVQALVYQLNRELSDAYVDANLRYIDLLLEGGEGEFLGQRIDVLGLEGVRELLDELPPGPRLDPDSRVRPHRGACARGDRRGAPGHGEPDRARGVARRGPHVGAVGAGAVVRARADDLLPRAAPRRSARSRASATKACSDGSAAGSSARASSSRPRPRWPLSPPLAVGLGIAVAFGAIIELGDVEGGQPWSRLPLLALGLALTGSALGALGSLLGGLAREGRTASLVAILAVLPIVFLGLVPREVAPAAAAISNAFPFAHGVAVLHGRALRPRSVAVAPARGGVARGADARLRLARPARGRAAAGLSSVVQRKLFSRPG